MRVNSVFDELELVIKMTISSKTHKEKNQTRTNKDDARMQWFELSMNDTIKQLIESPVGVLGMGVPRLACLRPAAWLKGGPNMAHLHQHRPKTLARGQASQGG